MTLKERINIRIGEELHYKLCEKAGENECSASSIVRLALKRYFGGNNGWIKRFWSRICSNSKSCTCGGMAKNIIY